MRNLLGLLFILICVDAFALPSKNVDECQSSAILTENGFNSMASPNYFITTWKTDNPGGVNNSSIIIGINPNLSSNYNYDVSWKNDGVWETGFTGNATHDYGTPGTYTVAIRGTFPSFQFYRGTPAKIITIEQWGNNVWSTMQAMFRSCPNFTYNAIDVPNLSAVSNISEMFTSAPLFNANLNNWDTGNVVNMQETFKHATSFNGAIGNWNVGNVTNMMGTFINATSFNQDLNNWNTSNVTNMQEMFGNATSFNGAIGNWNVGSVTTMRQMFLDATSFNQNLSWNPLNVVDMLEMFRNASSFNGAIGSWNVGNVTTMRHMFFGATSFNQSLNNWNPSSVVDMVEMFKYATSFNGAIGNWNVGNVTNMEQMFYGASSFNQDLNNWNTSNVLNMENMFRDAILFNGAIDSWNIMNVVNLKSMFKGALSFNQNLTNWNTSNATSMQEMFRDATSFNGAINNWNLSSVTNLQQMFQGATLFNQDLSNWNTSTVMNMNSMFQDASLFNGAIGNWNVGSVTSMNSMFEGATSFDQPLNNWNITNVTGFYNMFLNAGLSTPNYDKTLIGWSNLTLPQGIWFYGGNSTYCMSQSARTSIINTFGWNIQDGGKDCSDPCGESTVYTSAGWSNGIPDANKKAIISADYNTSNGNIIACGIVIDPGVTLTVAEGTTIRTTYNLNINGDLVFLSGSTGNGELAYLSPDGSITGEATVSRYMSANRSYRMVSPAVTTTNSIKANWQEGVNNQNTTSNLNPNPGFGTHITGSISGQNGFDATASGNASLYTVDVANQQFVAVNNTDIETLKAGNPYLLFVRGDRSIDLNNNTALPTTTILRAKGALAYGDQEQDFVSPSAGAFVMAGNPYQSAVDANFVIISSTNISPFHYFVYDPTLGDHGSYVTVELPMATTIPPSSANQYLQPGQAAQFSTETTGATTVRFEEISKTTGQFTQTNKAPKINDGNPKILGTLYTNDNYYNGGPLHDGFGIFFESDNNNAITATDARKPFNFGENIAIDHQGTFLSMEKREMPISGEVFQLFINGYKHSDYVLALELSDLENNSFYLDDNFSQTSTLLKNGANEYSFQIDPSAPDSQLSDRFSIRVENRLEIAETEMLSGIELYPNPMKDKLTLYNPNNEELQRLTIYDITGRTIKTIDLSQINRETIVDVSSLSLATYLVVVSSVKGETSRLFVKQ